MEKRLVLALVLTGLVVVATQFIFPTRKPPRAATPTRVDSPSVQRAESAATPAATAPQPTLSAPAPKATAERDSAGAQVPAVRPETVTVADSLAEFHISSVGAALVSTTMKRHRALDGTSQPAALLHSAGEPLLRYRLVSPTDTIALDKTPFTVANRTATTLDLSAALEKAQVTIRYSFVPDSYVVRVTGTVSTAGPGTFLLIDLPGALRTPEADSLDDQRHLAYAVKSRSQSAKGIPFSKLQPGERRIEQGPLTWAAAKNKYFIVGVLAPNDGGFAEFDAVGGARTSRTPSRAHGTLVTQVPNGNFSFEVYTGPQEWKRLVALGREFENSNPYGGWLQGIVQPFATIVMRILLWMHQKLSLSYGWVLVIFGITVRLVLWPLNQTAMRTNIKMQRIQPELQDIQKRYKSDPAKMQSEIMRVYKEHGMSPFSALSGCLPMLLPMPVLFALFFVFGNTIEFRGVPFLWLHDISLKDPFYILPLLMGVSMFGLSWIGLRNSPPNPQAKMMTYIFPVMMTFLLINFASGLNLYYTVQNLASIPQQWLIAHERAKAKT
jgi:YidC/Oxa1 family membrane protein insertase